MIDPSRDDLPLSAYLDGEVPLGERQRIEADLLANPSRGERLRELAAVRELVSGMDRPRAPFDLSASVLNRIQAASARPAILEFFADSPRAWPARLATMLTAAAALIAFALATPDQGHWRHVPTRSENVTGAGPTAKALDVVPDGAPEILANVEVVEPVESLAKSPTSDLERRRLEDLLTSSPIDTVLYVTDIQGGTAASEIGRFLEEAPRHSAPFSRIVVNQGFVADPDHPGKAIVFAVVMNEFELNQMRKTFEARYPLAVEEGHARPEVTANLAKVGEIHHFSGRAVAHLKRPGFTADSPTHALARDAGNTDRALEATIRQPAAGLAGAEPARSQGDELIVVPRDGPTPEQMRSGPHPSNRDLANAPTRLDPAEGDSPPVKGVPEPIGRGPRESLVLVWVREPAAMP